MKGIKDVLKFKKAQRLKGDIGNIQRSFMEDMKNQDVVTRQKAVATYLLDRFAI